MTKLHILDLYSLNEISQWVSYYEREIPKMQTQMEFHYIKYKAYKTRRDKALYRNLEGLILLYAENLLALKEEMGLND